MAALKLIEELGEELTFFADLAVGEKNLPICAVIFCIQNGKEVVYITIMLEEGDGAAVQVSRDVWEKYWKKVKPGMVVEFRGDVVNGSPKSTFTINGLGKVKIIGDKVFNFKRSPMPVTFTGNVCLVVEFAKLHQKSTKEKAPLPVSCRVTNGETIVLKIFDCYARSDFENLKAGQVIRVGPGRAKISEFGGKKVVEYCSSYNTLMNVSHGSSNASDAYDLNCLEEAMECNTGDVISVSCVILDDEENNAAYVVDVPGKHSGNERAPRVHLTKLPDTSEWKAGTPVRVVASVDYHEVVLLHSISVYADWKEDEEKIPVSLSSFRRYRPLLRPIPPSTPGSSSCSSSQDVGSRPAKSQRFE